MSKRQYNAHQGKRLAACKPMSGRASNPPMRTFEDTLEACGHTIAFWYDIGKRELTDDLKERLTEEAEQRTRAMISEDYRSGELNCCFEDGEVRGWWNIKREND